VVAPAYWLVDRKFPKGHVDILDRTAAPTVYFPGADRAGDIWELCSRQVAHKFIVPI